MPAKLIRFVTIFGVGKTAGYRRFITILYAKLIIIRLILMYPKTVVRLDTILYSYA